MTTIVSLAEFFDQVGARASATIKPDNNTSMDETGAGDLVRTSYGTRLFRGTVNVALNKQADIAAVAARVEDLEAPDMAFEFVPAGCQNKTSGTTTVASIAADRREFTVNAYTNPSGLEPVVGGYLTVAFGTKVSLHHVARVSGTGNRSLRVVPPLPFGVGVTDTVVFGAPTARAIVERSTPPTYAPKRAEGLSFDWVQVF